MKAISSFSRNEIKQIFSKARCLLKHAGLTLLCAPVQQNSTQQDPKQPESPEPIVTESILAKPILAKPIVGRILVITSRKVGNAPQRNKLRRQLRALFYEEKLFERGYDCVCIMKAPAQDLSFQELKQLILTAYATLSYPKN